MGTVVTALLGMTVRKCGTGRGVAALFVLRCEKKQILHYAQDDTYTVRDVGYPRGKVHGPSRRDFIAPQGDTSLGEHKSPG
jgi:hypothetical protein